RSEHTGQGRQYHQGLPHRYRAFRAAVGLASVARYDHHADRSHVVAYGEAVLRLLPSFQFEGSDIVHDRLEAVRLGIVRRARIVASSKGQYPRELSAEGTDHLVIDVPCAHTERFPGVEVLPRVG